MKRIECARKRISNLRQILRCPLCHSNMHIECYSLVCDNHHCFDIARKGYLNVLYKSSIKGYDKDLFVARHSISQAGLFNKLLEEIGQVISRQFPKEGATWILDAGCGEGSNTAYLVNQHNGFIGVGVDIAKEGIEIATRHSAPIVWCVADIADLPFQDEQFDIITNILSPANYAEFQRVLTSKGVLLKIIPESNHLIELRRLYYGETNKASYSNVKTVEHFKSSFTFREKKRVTYKFSLDKLNVDHLVKMSPLTWGETDEPQKVKRASEIGNVTIDCSILVGTK